MRVHELMTSTACAIEPETSLQQAAVVMDRCGVGALAVLRGNHVVGIITDRDLAIRGLAAGLAPDTPVNLVMTRGVHACHADEHIADVLLDMELLQIRRVPVENEADEFLGMLSLSDLAAVCPDQEVGRTFRHICRKPDQAAPDPELAQHAA